MLHQRTSSNIFPNLIVDSIFKLSAYKDLDSLTHLASLLMETPSSVISKLKTEVAKVALQHEDFDMAYNICKGLIESSYKHVWKVCRDLAFADKFPKSKEKMEMVCA